jgi:tetratricopeptide (TPR) repeat protein
MAEQFLAKFGISFLNLSVEVATAAVLHEKGDEFQESTKQFANNTGLVAFRFLSAWTLLNTDKLDDCIKECEKVEDDFSPILTLLGQASLEAHLPDKAINALERAVDIDPNEVLAWFQLAKAYSVVDNETESWNCLLQCKRLSQNNIEIAAFLAICAVKKPTAEKCKIAWDELFRHFSTVNSDPFAVNLLFELAMQQQSSDKLSDLLSSTDWKQFVQNENGNEFLQTYKKRLSENNFHEHIRLLECS